MNKLYSFFIAIFKVGCWLTGIAYLISCLTPLVSSQTFFGFAFLGLGFPLLFIVMSIYWILLVIFNRKKSWLVLLIIILGFKNISNCIGFNFIKKDTISAGQHIKILSWNVRNFPVAEKKDSVKMKQFENMVKFIASTNADIVCLQDFEEINTEPFVHYVEYISDKCKYPYFFFNKEATYQKPWGLSSYGTCILSRHPIVNTDSIYYGNPNKSETLGFADIVVNGKKLRFFNTHLRSLCLNIDLDTTIKASSYNFEKKDTNLIWHSSRINKLYAFDTFHVSQARLVKRVMDTTKTPFVFCGDINSVPSSYTYHLLSKNLNDAFLQCGKGFGATYISNNPFLRIDVILMSKELHAISYSSPKETFSDHYPVISEISLK